MNGIEWYDEPRVDGYGRVTLGRWGGWYVDVCPMLFGDRLVLTPETAPETYDYGWCYPKGGAAVVAALAWDPAIEAEPAGYIKPVGADRRRAGETALGQAVGVMTAPKPHTVYVVTTVDLVTEVERAFSNLPAAREYVDQAHGKADEQRVDVDTWMRTVNGYQVWVHRLRVYEGAKKS